MNDAKLIGALKRCIDSLVCETDCPGYQYCISGGGNIMEHCAERIEEMTGKVELLAEVIEGTQKRYVYFAVENPILDQMDKLPEAGLLGFHAYDKPRYIALIDQMGWGFAIYNRRLEHDELMCCGLTSAQRSRA